MSVDELKLPRLDMKEDRPMRLWFVNYKSGDGASEEFRIERSRDEPMRRRLEDFIVELTVDGPEGIVFANAIVRTGRSR